MTSKDTEEILIEEILNEEFCDNNTNDDDDDMANSKKIIFLKLGFFVFSSEFFRFSDFLNTIKGPQKYEMA